MGGYLHDDTAGAIDRAVIQQHAGELGCQGRIGCINNAAFKALDIVGQDHIVLHHIVQNIHSTAEHIEAVTQIAQGVVVTCQVVVGSQIQILVSAGLLVEDFPLNQNLIGFL